jgi:hypothetical protein
MLGSVDNWRQLFVLTNKAERAGGE